MIYKTAQLDKTCPEWEFVNHLFTGWHSHLQSPPLSAYVTDRNHQFSLIKTAISENDRGIGSITFIGSHTTPSESLLELIPQIPEKLPYLTSLKLKYDFLSAIPVSFEHFNKEFKKIGVQNCYFPLFIPESFILYQFTNGDW